MDGQGPYTKFFDTFFPMKIEAAFYEFLRENIPIIDAAINRLTSLDGHIIVKGYKPGLVAEIQDWIDNVKVNDIETGLQAFHRSLTNEAFEQGFGLGEFVTDKKRTDIVGLRVADSKFIKFERDKTTRALSIKQKVTGDSDWRPLDQDTLLYVGFDNDNQNPYGTPRFRSCEFVSKILKTIQNSLLNQWERFGDPSFSLIYKTRNKEKLEDRRKSLSADLDTAVRAKRDGKSADFVAAIHTDADLKLDIIGANGQVLTVELPSRHVLEQIVAKSGLAAWMLGLQWSTTERLSNAEAEMILADVVVRQASKMPLFNRLIKTLLLLRGRTWQPGDWWLEWAQVNLHDIVAQAQARFLNAQADMYYLQNASAAGIELDINDLAIGKTAKENKTGPMRLIGPVPAEKGCHCGKTHSAAKELNRPTPWPELDQVENDYEKELVDRWGELKTQVLTILKLTDVKGAPGPGAKDDLPGLAAFTFSEEQRAAILQAMKDWIGVFNIADDNSPVRWYYGQSYSLGLIQAAQLVGGGRPILDIIKNREIYDELCKNGFQLLKDNSTKAIVNKILPEMQAQMLAGTNPRHVADRLERLFGDQNSDWQRLARTEMTASAESAKLDEWKERGVSKVEFTPAPDACSICNSLAGDYETEKCPVPAADTHPRCRCSIRPAALEA